MNQIKLIKLHRSPYNRVFAGVLGGVAEYLGWRPLYVRLLFCLIIIVSAGVTLPLAMVFYGVMWFIMPQATAESYLKYKDDDVGNKQYNVNDNVNVIDGQYRQID